MWPAGIGSWELLGSFYPRDPVCLSTRAQVAVRAPELERVTRGRCPSRACPGWPPEHQLWRVWRLKNFWSRSSGVGRGGAWESPFFNQLCKQFRSTARLLMQDRGGKSAGVLLGPHSAVSAGTSPPSATVRAAHPCRLSEGMLLSMGSLCRGCQGPPATKSRGPAKGPQTFRESFCVDGHCDPENRFRMEFSCIFSIYNTFPFTDYRRKSLMLRDPTPVLLKLRESP